MIHNGIQEKSEYCTCIVCFNVDNLSPLGPVTRGTIEAVLDTDDDENIYNTIRDRE